MESHNWALVVSTIPKLHHFLAATKQQMNSQCSVHISHHISKHPGSIPTASGGGKATRLLLAPLFGGFEFGVSRPKDSALSAIGMGLVKAVELSMRKYNALP